MDNTLPYISVIIPAYNAEAFVRFAIESVIKQPMKNIEIIIINDGSVDGTLSVCQTLSELDPRIVVINSDNKGAGAARNIGIQNARGTWIMFLDSDDAYISEALDEYFEQKLREYEQNNIEIIYTATAYVDFTIRSNVKINHIPVKIDAIPSITFWGAIYYRQFLVDNKLFFYEYRKQDVETAFRFIAKANAKQIVTDESMSFYMQRNNASSNTHTWNLQDLHEVKCLIYYDLSEKYSSSNELSDVAYQIAMEELGEYYRACYNNRFIQNKEPIKQINRIFRKEFFGNIHRVLSLVGKKWFIYTTINSIRANLLLWKKPGLTKSDNTEGTPVYYADDKLVDRYERVSGCLIAILRNE